MSERWLLRGGRLLDPAANIDYPADLLIEEGRITARGEGLRRPGAEEIDCRGCIVAPGFIDIHVHLRDPGQTHKEDIASGTAAAAAGGFVAVVSMPNTQPPIDTAQLVTYVKATAAATGAVAVWPAGCVTKGQKGTELAEIGEMAAAGAVAITDDGRPVADAEVMRLALLYSKQFGLPVLSHAETPSLSAGGSLHEGQVSARLGLRGIPVASEAACVARDLLLAEATGGHLHIQHVSAAASVDLIRWAKARGVRVTAEVTPHHLILADTALLERPYHTNLKMNPPLRSEADRQALLQGLADGTIDLIATDHAPHHIDDKEVEFGVAAFGVTGLETAVSLCLDRLVRPGLLSLEQLILKMSTLPARTVGQRPPSLADGAAADITVLDPQRPVLVGRGKSRSHNSPFLTWQLTGAPVATLVAGRPAMLAGGREVATLG